MFLELQSRKLMDHLSKEELIASLVKRLLAAKNFLEAQTIVFRLQEAIYEHLQRIRVRRDNGNEPPHIEIARHARESREL